MTPVKTHELFFMFLCERRETEHYTKDATEVEFRKSTISCTAIDSHLTNLTILPERVVNLPWFLAARLQTKTIQARYAVFSLASGQLVRGYIPVKQKETS